MPILNACFDFDKTEISEIPHLVEMHLLVARRTPQGLFASRRDASIPLLDASLRDAKKKIGGYYTATNRCIPSGIQNVVYSQFVKLFTHPR